MKSTNRYNIIIEHIFKSRHKPGMAELDFRREEMILVANKLGVALPKNLGDVIYSFRYRSELPELIRNEAPKGKTWIIRSAGQGIYRLVLINDSPLKPNLNLSETKVPDATPGIIAKYAFSDEQALLARLR